MSRHAPTGCAFIRGSWKAVAPPDQSNVVWIKRDPYHDFNQGDCVEFRLTYEGLLFGPTQKDKRAAHKHEVRRVFHRQLKRLWQVNPFLRADWTMLPTQDYRRLPAAKPLVEYVAQNNERFGYRFVPLVRRDLSLLCSIHILFLRPDQPGDVLKSGDIDNRLKSISDALCMPRHAEQLGPFKTPEADENPFFCLLEDDSVITHLSIETDMLFQPTGEQFDVNDARLVLTVRIKPYWVNGGNEGFG